jgi:DNA-binding FrmR family transcriptional regulator
VTWEVAAGMLTDHVRHCVADTAVDTAQDGHDRMDEFAATIRQVIRL